MTDFLPEEVRKATSLSDAAAHLGAYLELSGPAPEAATQRALDNPLYARALVSLRKMPELRDQVLESAESLRVHGQPTEAAQSVVNNEKSVAAQAAGALLKWGMAGLEHAKPWQIETRLAACNACSFLADAPDDLIYRGAKVFVGKDAKICSSCRCLVNTKAALATEHCPERDPDDPNLSRWGEPYVLPEEHPKGPW
ncbi:MAG: hypothetical protein RDA78_25620 [Roseibium sp.]|uniref:hypothetical protein n=1 Tax=Roseibium sp. TaxID=1936156 RepID=UPI003D9C63A7